MSTTPAKPSLTILQHRFLNLMHEGFGIEGNPARQIHGQREALEMLRQQGYCRVIKARVGDEHGCYAVENPVRAVLFGSALLPGGPGVRLLEPAPLTPFQELMLAYMAKGYPVDPGRATQLQKERDELADLLARGMCQISETHFEDGRACLVSVEPLRDKNGNFPTPRSLSVSNGAAPSDDAEEDDTEETGEAMAA